MNDGAIGDSCFAPGDLGYELYLSHITYDEKDFEPHSFLDPPSPSRVTVATSKKKAQACRIGISTGDAVEKRLRWVSYFKEVECLGVIPGTHTKLVSLIVELSFLGKKY